MAGYLFDHGFGRAYAVGTRMPHASLPVYTKEEMAETAAEVSILNCFGESIQLKVIASHGGGGDVSEQVLGKYYISYFDISVPVL